MPIDPHVTIRPPRRGEAAALSALALRSKGHWGYDAAFLDACRAELTYTEDQLDHDLVGVVDTAEGTPAGFYRVSGAPPVGELDALFVDRPHIGSGLGGVLLARVLHDAAVAGFTALELDADPGAASFYTRFGAIRVGESPSGSIPGRVLPRLRFSLPPADPSPPRAEPSPPRADDGTPG